MIIDRLTLINLVVQSVYGVGKRNFSARYPFESSSIRKLRTDGDDVAQLLNRALDQMDELDALRQQGRRPATAEQRLSACLFATAEKLAAHVAPHSQEPEPEPPVKPPVRRELLTSYHLFPRA